MRQLRFVCCLLFTALLCRLTVAEEWMRFRGPNGQGISSEKNLPLTWSSDKNVAWKTAIPGTGWSSPIVYGDRIFLTSATEKGASCRVICIDRKSGDLLWNTEVHRQKPGPKRQQNSYATSTPVTDGKCVYAAFYDGTVVAVDFSGKRLWKNTDVRFHSVHGLGASPVVAHGTVIMPFDGSSRKEQKLGFKVPWKDAVVMALDAETGKPRWKGRRGLSRVGHVTPIFVNKGSQLISSGGDRVQGFDAKTGERIWSIYSRGEGVTPSPVIGEGGVIYTSSGFEAPTIRAIRLGGKGDVTKSHIVWEQKKGVPVLASPLYIKPYLYTITRGNIMHCIATDSGDVVWAERLKGVHSASPVYADGKIYVLSEDGVTLVLQPGDKYNELARNELGETCLASMAVSRGQFFLRSSKHLYCIGK